MKKRILISLLIAIYFLFFARYIGTTESVNWQPPPSGGLGFTIPMPLDGLEWFEINTNLFPTALVLYPQHAPRVSQLQLPYIIVSSSVLWFFIIFITLTILSKISTLTILWNEVVTKNLNKLQTTQKALLIVLAGILGAVASSRIGVTFTTYGSEPSLELMVISSLIFSLLGAILIGRKT